jgi:hypothetical protein
MRIRICFLPIVSVAAGLLSAAATPSAADVPAKREASSPPSPKSLAPRSVTLQGEVSLSQALTVLARDTGNVVEDRRQTKTDPKFALRFQQASFWQALDTLAQNVNARVSLHQRAGRIALVDGPRQDLPTSYSGWFRTRLKRLDAARDLETKTHFYRAQLEIAWEPRFQPYLLETGVTALVLTDEKGQPATATGLGTGKASVVGRSELTFDLPLPALPRSAAQIGLLKGTFSAIGPGSLLRFEFDQLRPIAQPDQVRKQRQEGVAVELRELRVDEELCTVGLLHTVPTEGTKFESFQSWVGNNEVYFEKKRGGARVMPSSYNSDDPSGEKVMLRYYFEDKANEPLLAHLEEWKLVYRTPGRIIEVPIPFEFRNLALP